MYFIIKLNPFYNAINSPVRELFETDTVCFETTNKSDFLVTRPGSGGDVYRFQLAFNKHRRMFGESHFMYRRQFTQTAHHDVFPVELFDSLAFFQQNIS